MQSKRYVLIFIALLAILGGLYFLKKQPKTGNTPGDYQDFAVDQTNEVTMIFMTNQSGDKQIFLRKQADDSWTINDKHPAWQKKVNFLLNETMAKVEVQGPAPKAAVPNILKYMSINGIKVEVYRNNQPEPSKVYIVGNTTPTQLGTYFKFPGESKPMIMQIPGISHQTSKTICNSYKTINNLIKNLEKDPGCLDSLKLETSNRKINRTSIENIKKYLLRIENP